MSSSLRRIQMMRVWSGPLLVAATVAASAWFAGKLVAHVGEAEAFDDRHHGAAVTPPPAPVRVASGPSDAEHASAGGAFITRNMFCSSCRAPEGGGGGGPVASSHAVPRLIATQVGSRESWATIDDPVSGASGLFARGATLPGGAVIESIERGAIVLRFTDTTSQRVPLASGAAPVKAGPGPGEKVAGAGKPPAPEYADRIRAVGDNRWEVDRTLIRELVQAGTGQRAAAKGVRLQPIAKDGKLAGIKVATAREGSLGQLLGLKPGDVIESVDGKPLDSPERLMDLYARLDDTRRVDLGVSRKGASTTLIYDLP